MEEKTFKHLVTSDLIREIDRDLKNQDIFIKTLLVKMSELGLEKRDINSNFDIGFKLGEIFRMLTEYQRDSEELKLQISLVFEIVEKELLPEQKDKNKDGSRILFD